MTMIHCLKTWPEPFADVLSGRKRFELRRDDRGFEVGDLLCLQEWEPATQSYTGREFQARVSCITRSAGPVALLDRLVVLGLEEAEGLGDIRREQARLVAYLFDLALALGVPCSFGEVPEGPLLDRAVELREVEQALPGLLEGVREAHGTVLLGSAPRAKEQLAEVAKTLAGLVGGGV